MFYVKNVPAWERALRVVLGLACLAWAALNWSGGLLHVAAGITGATLALTGLVGFCPMCAVAGRKFDKGN